MTEAREEKEASSRQPYPSDVSDEEGAFVVFYLTLMTEDAPQREYPLREVFNGLRWIVRCGAQWRLMPHDLPPWPVVYQQTRRWLKAGVNRWRWRLWIRATRAKTLNRLRRNRAFGWRS